ncbi:MAG: ABC transporter substrate-binding protein [Vicinamibacterales bacterium]
MGVASVSSTSSLAGITQLVGILSTEGLVKIGDDGRAEAWLAEGWNVSPDGLLITVHLRSGAKFHDGSLVTSAAVVDALRRALPGFMGPAFEDVDHIAASGTDRVEIGLRRISPFVLEALEMTIRTPAGSGTGPFQQVDQDTAEVRANSAYYLGRPAIDRLALTNYPNVRAAWAEMLRDRIDMLYEVGADALDSLQGAQNVRIFTFTQRYQYVVIFNTNAPALRRAEVRRALNMAIDRDSVVREALAGHGLPSSGPVWPNHWAVTPDSPTFQFDQRAAEATLAGRQVSFTLLVRPDLERMALVLKQQLQAVNVDLSLEERTSDQIVEAISRRDFDAALIDLVSGPSLFRPYEFWRTGGSFSFGQPGSARVDAALDRIRQSSSDDEYRRAVAGFQQAVVDDPPAIFLAWRERARAVNRRFDVATEPGRDILTTLRLWRPVSGDKIASGN